MYVKGNLRQEIMFPSRVSDDDEMLCYSNSYWCCDRVDKRSTIRYIFMYLGAPISWCSKKQPMVALSTCWAEYIADALSACQAV